MSYTDGYFTSDGGPLAGRLEAQERARHASPPPTAPIRVSCAACGGRAVLRPGHQAADASQFGGRLDEDGRFWCCARCLPPDPDAPNQIRDLVRATRADGEDR